MSTVPLCGQKTSAAQAWLFSPGGFAARLLFSPLLSISICVVICDPWRAWRSERNFTHTHFELRVTFWTSIYRVSYGDSISANKPRLEPLSSSLNLSTEVGKHAPNCLDSLSRVLKLSTVDCKRAVTREIICYSLRDVMKIPRYSPIPKPTPS